MSRMLFLIGLFLVIQYSKLCGSDVTTEDKDKLVSLYRTIGVLFEKQCADYKVKEEIPWEQLRIGTVNSTGKPLSYFVEGNIVVHARADTFVACEIFNYNLTKKLDAGIPNRIPNWSIDKATSKAMEYLEKCNIRIPQGCELTTIRYSQGERSCWEARWTRSSNGYLWDDFNVAYSESIYVIFHEEMGLVGVGSNIYSPDPKTLSVKLSRLDAIEKAAKYVPLVMRTPFYPSGLLSQPFWPY